MRWQRPLRWSIAVAGLGFAVLLYVRYERRPPASDAPLPPRIEGGATLESTMSPGAKQVRVKGDKEVGAWSYTRMLLMPDGRRLVEKLRYEGDRDGKPFIISADKAELRAASAGTDPNEIPEETHLLGNVVMREQDGMEIRTEDAVYRESVATLDMPGLMTFSDQRQSGSGVGATYDRNAELLTLKDQAAVAIAPDESGQGSLDAHARTIAVNRAIHDALLEGGATIVRDREVISAASVDMHLSEDNQGVQMMELRQKASIVPTRGSSKTPEMRADDINIEFLPDGRTMKRAQLVQKASMFLAAATGRKQIAGDLLDVQLGADGQTVTNLAGVGAPVLVSLPASGDLPKRVINARELRATGDEKNGLTAANFRARVVFVETRAAARGQEAVNRTVRSDELTLALNGGDFSDIKDAKFQDAVRFENGDTTGAADSAVYLAKAGKLVLRPNATGGKKSWVATDRIRVDAKDIDIDLDKTIITASIDLTTQTIPDSKSKASLGLFDETKAVFGKAGKLEYDDARHEAVYTGAAQLFQTATGAIIKGETIRIDDTSGDLRAEGGVETQFPMDNLEGAKSAQPKATAARFEYSDASHHALYAGTEVSRAQFNSPDGIIRGVTIELWLNDEGRELNRMLVTKGVEARVSADRTARGDRMDHDAKTGIYLLSGQPAKLIQRTLDKGVEGCSESRGPSMSFTKTKDLKDQGTLTVSDAKGAGTASFNLPSCADWTIK